MELSDLTGRRALIVASTGGHLSQAVRWSTRLRLHPDSTFVTFDTEQSHSLVGDRRHIFVPYVAPRQWSKAYRAARELLARVDPASFDIVLSTGAAVGLSGLSVAYRHRKPYIFIESVSRFRGPSLTGRILERAPRVRRFTQHQTYAGRNWQYAGSLLDDFRAVNGGSVHNGSGLRVFVTLGTIRPYRFDRLIDSILPSLSNVDVVEWQTGETTRTGLPGTCSTSMAAEDFDAKARAADVVITHAGVGTLLRLLELGKQPVVMPRRRDHGEHVDDHQIQAAGELQARGLIRMAESEIDRALLKRAAATRIVRSLDGAG